MAPDDLRTVDDARAAALLAGLRYVTDGEPGFHRVRTRRGIAYVHPDGSRLRDGKHLARIASLAIPPAWSKVWICATSRGHIQATGQDARERKQYRYHAAWRSVRDAAKYRDILLFASALPRLRAAVRRDLRATSMTKAKVVATAVRVMEITRIRVGSDCYTAENGSYGLTTLLDRHVRLSSKRVVLRFRGKGGIQRRASVADPKLASLVKECRDVPGPRLFQYLDEAGRKHALTSTDVNAYIKGSTGHRVTAKAFRTWAATLLAAERLYSAPRPGSVRDGKAQVTRAIAAVAERLGNTPAVCRSSYIHPAIITAYLDGALHQHLAACLGRRSRRPASGLSAMECAVLELFERLHGRRRAA